MNTDCKSLPSVFLLGAQKAGTSALAEYLDQHPEVFVTYPKEPNYFALKDSGVTFTGPGDFEAVARGSVLDEQEYYSLFRNVASKVVKIDASTLYLYSTEAANAIAEVVPSAKHIIILRDPVKRAFSSFMHLVRDGRETEMDFRRALDAEGARIEAGYEFLWHYKTVGMYAQQVERYINIFGKKNIHIELYEDFVRDPKALLKRLFAFMNVDTAVTINTSLRVNRSGVPRSKILHRFLRQHSSVKKFIRKGIPKYVWRPIFQRLQTANLKGKTEMDAEVELNLREAFREDIDRLERIIERDLSLWK